MKLKVSLTLLILLTVMSWVAFNPNDSKPAKINGVSLVAPRDSISVNALASVKNINATWVAIIPYGFIRKSEPTVIFDTSHQWWGEKSSGVISTITYAENHGLNVMLKPHTWIAGQGWAGDFDLNSEEEWLKWENSYRNYILHYAKLADSLNVKMFCIGTEYRKAVVKRSAFWVDLINQIRNVYSGKLIYAANWDNYQNITFWNKLDYIGIDAYFPLTNEKTPHYDSLVEKWNIILPNFEAICKQYNKKIVFTEFGYQSVDYSTKGHWMRNDVQANVNQEAQANAYKAIFKLWDQDWFEGGFLWKWYTNHLNSGGPTCKEYTPQNKQAEIVIADFYCN